MPNKGPTGNINCTWSEQEGAQESREPAMRELQMLMFCPVLGQKHLPPFNEDTFTELLILIKITVFGFFWIKKLYILHSVFVCEFLCLHGESTPEGRAECSERSFLQLLPLQTIKLLLVFSGSTASKSFLPSVSPLIWWKVWEMRKVE